ncbi:cytochrome c oxidase assembly protein [Pseudokordiimonas caeni]|uniref:cytochrome c oxidase assembly protein n=1 Tax=Pseudokordiimonas caeni TaxID=2997908 RepID=UPI0028111E49|nr:cytochrome c oxidase assembly protein [Pseudokordiimonas caeni]
MTTPVDKSISRNNRVGIIVGVVALGMVGASYAAVPLYKLFCQVTGYGGTTSRAEGVTGEVLDRTMRVRFNASLNGDMPWQFKPAQHDQTVRLGEQALAYYEAYNPTDRAITGTATYNVAPLKVGGYFAKIDCFCFTEQTLQPGERVMMPVVYFIDPAMVEDRSVEEVTEVTLSYTFFVKDEKEVASGR